DFKHLPKSVIHQSNAPLTICDNESVGQCADNSLDSEFVFLDAGAQLSLAQSEFFERECDSAYPWAAADEKGTGHALFIDVLHHLPQFTTRNDPPSPAPPPKIEQSRQGEGESKPAHGVASLFAQAVAEAAHRFDDASRFSQLLP